MELFNQGLTLMTYGISTVFIFLCVLIGAMTLMSSILQKLPDDSEPSAQKNISNSSTNIDGTLLQVLQAAVNEHRNRNSI